MLHCLNITDKPCKKIKTIIVKKNTGQTFLTKNFTVSHEYHLSIV